MDLVSIPGECNRLFVRELRLELRCEKVSHFELELDIGDELGCILTLSGLVSVA